MIGFNPILSRSFRVHLVRGTGRDEAFRPVFGTPKNRGMGCPMG